jgi:two-component system, NarL family, invasion response regulator UvrY
VHALLEQIPAAVGARLQECKCVDWLGELAQHDHSHRRVGLPQDRCGPDALVARRRRHADIGQDDVRRIGLDGLEKRREVRVRAKDFDVRLAGEHLLEAFPHDEVVLRYYDADGHEGTIVGVEGLIIVDTSPGECMRAPRGTPAGAIAGAGSADECSGDADGAGSGAESTLRTPMETHERGAALNAPTVKVMMVDDQAVFRDVAREVIEATVGFEHVGEATCGEEALALADELGPDLVLVDVRMPGIDGLETARRLRASHPASTTVLISTAAIASLPSGFASCGAVAFVRKQDFGPSLLQRLWSEHGRRPSPRSAD